MKKIFLTIFLSAICFLAMNTSDALASESSAFKSEQLSIATYTDTDAEGNITRTAPKPSANLGEAYKDWIFAGWYTDANCTTTVGKTVTEGTYYAKYVPSEVLSAKCQVSAETTDTSPTSQLRIVSTVDSLKYSKVGFDIVFNNKTIQYSTSKVFSKIEAATDGVAYGFSPNIFDLQSEYFITATLINIKNENFDEGFLIKPYWVTKDGTKVYGVSRYARVEDSYLGIVNVPVRLYSDNQAATGTATVAYDANKLQYLEYDTGYVFDTIESVDSTSNSGKVTVSAKTSSGNEVMTDGMLVNLRFQTKTGVTLPKKNEFAVTMNSSDIYAPKVVYMNYITGDYSGDPDTNWYDSSKSTFVLTTPEELYGLATLSATNSFGGKIIYLGADITIDSDWQAGVTGHSYPWSSIGSANAFAGTFDGQGRTINGIYVNDTNKAVYTGLFAQVSGTVQNLNLENSYIASNGLMLGSITGYLSGNLRGVSSGAIVLNSATDTNDDHETGGLVGRFGSTSEATITNCLFSGKVTSNSRDLGGIVGRVARGTKFIEHCLNTGTVTSNLTGIGIWAGGIVGGVDPQLIDQIPVDITLEVSDSLNTGTVSAGHFVGVGAVFGFINSQDTIDITLENIYATNQNLSNGTSMAMSGIGSTETYVDGSCGFYDKDEIAGYTGYTNANFALSFYTNSNKSQGGYWVTRKDDTPMLKTFAEHWSDYGWYSTAAKTIELETVQELYAFSEISQSDPFGGDTIKLVKDITVNEGNASNWGTTAPKRVWTPIGNNTTRFSGTFDGQGHSISGIYVNMTGDYAGLFGATATSACIQDLRLENSYIYTSGNHVGSIAGRGNGTFDRLYSNATVIAGGYNVGGIVGQMNEGANNQFTNCWFDGSISGNRAGGMVGFALCYRLTMTNCLNTGNIRAGEYVGGLCGSRTGEANPNYFTIQDCMATGSLTHTDSSGAVGAIVGQIQSGLGKKVDVDTVYGRSGYSVAGVGSLNSGTVELLSAEQFTGAQARYSTSFGFYGEEEATDNWVARKNEYPGLRYFVPESEWYTGDEQIIVDTSWYVPDKTNGSTFVIDTAAKLYGLAETSKNDSYFYATIKLGADITVNIGDAEEWGKEAAINNWTPICTTVPSTVEFGGVFDGQNHTIKGLYMNTNTLYAGLFGLTNANGQIKNLSIENSYFQSSNMALGSVVGFLGGTMDNVYSSATVVTNNKQCGGIIGRLGNGNEKTVSNCWFDGTVTSTYKGTMQGCGGIIGLVERGTKNITQCLNTGKVTVDTDLTGGMIGAGGLIGQIQNASAANVIVNLTDCISVGEIQMDHPNGAGSVFGFSKKCDDGTGSVTVNITKTYTNQKYSGEKGCNASQGIGLVYEGTTCTVKPTVLTDAQLKGAQARYNTPFGFYGEDEITDHWVTRQNDYPGLTKFVAESERYIGDEQIEADTSWYKKDATNGSTYVIDTAAKLYGLVEKSKVDSYFYATVKLGADITVNIGDANEWATKEAVNNWEPISRTYPFTGKFDGQGYTIKGLYMDTDIQYGGLFAQVNSGTFNSEANYLKNLRIENSYFQSSANNLGSIAGLLVANMSNVYSDAIVVTSNKQCGGLIGQFNGQKSISNCWFDGTVTSTCTEAQQGCGGLVGLVDKAGNTIEDCLNTGDVTVVSGRTGQLLGVGGLVGMSVNAGNSMIRLQITDCISAGVVTVDHPRGTGSVVGVLNNTNDTTTHSNELILTNVYTTNQYVETSTQYNWTDDVCTGVGINLNNTATITGAVIVASEEDRFMGYAAYDTTEKLDFENVWTLRKSGVPALKEFVSESEQYTTVDADLALSSLGAEVTLREKGLDAGSGSYVITVDDTDGSIYTNYLNAIASKEFVEFANNDAGLATQGVQNVAYEKAEDGFKWVVNVTHAGNEKQKTYVAVSTCETLSPHLKGSVTYEKEDGYTTTSPQTPTFTMMKVTNQADLTAPGNSFVIQLSNGHFIINDGGFGDDLSTLIDYLKSLSGGKKPIVEAWVISHAHSDHVGIFERLYKDKRDNINTTWADELYVEGIYYNESAAYIKGNFAPVESTTNPGEMIYDVMDARYIEKVYRGMDLLKTTEGNTPEVYRYRTGQRFTFADVTMDVVQMEEQILEYLQSNGVYSDGSNGTNTSVLFTINDKRVYMSGDEAWDNMFNFTKVAYTDTYLNNLDVYVAPHHGSNTFYDFGAWCTNDGRAKFGMVLFPCLTENPPLWKNVSTETNYKLISQFTTDKNVYTYAKGNVVLTLGDTISVSK